MGIKITDGELLLDTLNRLPTKAQQVFMAIVASKIYEQEDASIDALGWMASLGEFNYSDCESPIEIIFAFCYDYYISYLGFPFFEYFALYPQKHITANGKNYRADFAVDTEEYFSDCTENVVKVVFECDGHDFHERTKDQVIKDNNRDYDLKIAGYDVVHFSGSEIYRDPLGCAKRAVEFVIKKAGAVYGNL